MVKEIWRPAAKGSNGAAAIADLPALNASDYEYLFTQLLEGVAHGWQQPRVMKFFAKLKHRIPKTQWLGWLETYGNQLLESPNPNEDLARRMIQLSELDCGEVTTMAGDYGQQALGKIYGGYTEEVFPALEGADGMEIGYLPELADLGLADMAFAPLEFSAPVVEMPLPELPVESDVSAEPSVVIPSSAPHPLADRAPAITAPGWNDEDTMLPTFGEVPPELRLSSNRSTASVSPPPAPSGFLETPLPVDETLEPMDEPMDETVEERQISIEEFEMMLRDDPELLQQISLQLGIETTDPQVVVDAVIAQMQQQISDTEQP